MGTLCTSAQEKTLTIWVMPNEPLWKEYTPSDNEIIKFLNANPNVLNTKEELVGNKEFAKQVLAQTEILKHIKEYEKDNPHVKIRVKFIEWSKALVEIDDAISSDEIAPDIVQLGSTWTAYFIEKSALAELSGEVDETLFYKSSLKSCKTHNSEEIYGLPWLIDIRVIYYWKDIIKNEDVLQTWNITDFKKVCKDSHAGINIQKNTSMKSVFAIPIGEDWNLLHNFAIWLGIFGNEIIEIHDFPLQSKNAVFNNNDGLDAVRFLMDLCNCGCLQLPEDTTNGIEEKFKEHEYGMIITGPWLVKELEKKYGNEWSKNISMTLPPIGPNNERFTFVGGSNLAILKISHERDNFEEAVKFTKYLTSTDVQFDYSISTGLFPSNTNAMYKLIGRNSIYEVFDDGMKYGKPYISIPEWGDVEKKMTEDLYFVWKNIRDGDFNSAKSKLDSSSKEVDETLFPPRFPPWFVLVLFMLVLFIVAILVLRGPKPKPSQPDSYGDIVGMLIPDQPARLIPQQFILKHQVLNLDEILIQKGVDLDHGRKCVNAIKEVFEVSKMIKDLTIKNKKLNNLLIKYAPLPTRMWVLEVIYGTTNGQGNNILLEKWKDVCKDKNKLVEILKNIERYEKEGDKKLKCDYYPTKERWLKGRRYEKFRKFLCSWKEIDTNIFIHIYIQTTREQVFYFKHRKIRVNEKEIYL